jgi:hypothetical protein
LVELVPWNLVQNSENFTSNWNPNSNTITANTTTAPNGTTTADTFTLIPSGDSSVYQAVNGESNNYTTSVYAKYVSGDKYLYFFSQLNSQGAKVWFDIQNGTVSNQLSGFTGTIENVGNGWYKCSMYNTTASISDYIQFGISTTNSSRTLSNNSVAYFWGAQVNVGTAKPYFPTTDRLNVPRLTYQNGGGGCPSLLLEKQSTNLAQYSEQFDNVAWDSAGGASVVANNAISPDGTQNADTSLTSATTGLRQFVGGITNGALCTLTLYVKQASSSSATHIRVTVNDTSSWTGAASTKVALTNQWQRVTLNWTATGTAAYFLIGSPDETGSSDTSCYGNVAVWGAQLEQSSYATSYIGPTTSASATRVADVCSKTGISSLIGQTEGVAFIDFDFNGNYSSGGIIPFSLDGGAGNELYAWIQTNGTVIFEVYNAFVGQVVISGSIGAVGRKKIAFAYKQNDFAVYLNGTQVGTDTSGTVPTMSRLFVGKYYANDTYNINAGINQTILFPTRLTNAELASLTTI